jgi:hypothetical protein
MPKRQIETLWDDLRLWLSDATNAAVKEAEDLTRRGHLKMELLRVSRDLEKKMAELGGLAYDRWAKSPDTPLEPDAELGKLVKEIRRLDAERQDLRREYEEEKEQRRRR